MLYRGLISQLAAIFLAVFMLNANAQVIDFDSGLTHFAPIPTNYNGFEWTNFYALDTATYAASTPEHDAAHDALVVKSLPFFAFNGFGDTASFSSDQSFTLNSFYLAAAWRNNLDVVVQGWNQGALVNSVDLVADTTTTKLVSLNWQGIDKVIFTASGGYWAGLEGDGSIIVLDNVNINTPVPEPKAWIMLLLGLSLIQLQRRFKS